MQLQYQEAILKHFAEAGWPRLDPLQLLTSTTAPTGTVTTLRTSASLSTEGGDPDVGSTEAGDRAGTPTKTEEEDLMERKQGEANDVGMCEGKQRGKAESRKERRKENKKKKKAETATDLK
eukprot:12406035-Prorocentrum_lima.AAC.1